MANKLQSEEDFVEYIESLKFEFCHTRTANKYYSNSNGNQIKIDRGGNISLINSYGKTLKVRQSFTKKEILEHV